ncbi:T9SS type A sorting domain-containing protein [Pseudochryseolinea flava]|uniref:Secretion system C-terminal sorting domain-containing protein n=1 Tax=Pseudochryseolinea flava TaxID=2059302 RepID=A0A364Y1V1_9BACT|nr:T9SS type A sorting domain-containing protein [Pseudochryseolinea flava]RAW00853.1 hypothetical protein DQQ10_11450 [Pseudochryseolinea flava]
MKNILYAIGMFLCMQPAFAETGVGNGDKPTHDVRKTALGTPYILEATLYIDQTYLRFGVENYNGRGITEIHRSTSPDSGYEVVATYTDLGQFYVDQWNLKPRTTFWYKARVVDGTEVSGFTEPFHATTFSFNYKPTLNVFPENPTKLIVQLTDNSYNDIWYTVDRRKLGGSYETMWEFQSLDSGEVHYYDDGMLEQGTTYIYNVHITTIYSEGTTDTYNVATDTATTPIDEPLLEVGPIDLYSPCGNEVPLILEFPDVHPVTELYRSLSPDGPFVLIETFPIDGSVRIEYTDRGIPRQTNYYKARCVGPHAVSDFTPVVSYDARSHYYKPDFSVTVDEEGVAEITLKDNTYADEWYSVERMRHHAGGVFEPVFYVEMTDSGSTYTFRDTTLVPGSGYTYYLQGKTEEWCVGWPGSEGEFLIKEVDITTPPDDYTITGFTLVDPVTNQDIGPLLPNMYFEATNLPNIRANVSSNKVKSVIFFLNNKRRTDNGGPIFSYWPEKNGDYDPGVYTPGSYQLVATPYSEKNGAGIKGPTEILPFTIRVSRPTIQSFTLVDPITDQDIGPLVDGAVVDASLAANIRANTTNGATAVMFFLNNKRRADNGAPIFSYFPEKNGDYEPGLVTPGGYVLKATPSTLPNGEGTVGQTVTIQFSVAGAATLAEVKTVGLYPNPIVSESELMVNVIGEKEVSVQVYDQFGNPIGQTVNAKTNLEGSWKFPVANFNLTRGAYIINVMIEGTRHSTRVVVE